MSWPLPHEFNEAIQNPRVAFSDPDLKSAVPIVGAQGLPLPRSGNFADVYQLRGADGRDGRDWAVKCFTRPVVGLGDRYARVSEALARTKFPFTVGFTFLAEGIRVGDAWRPVVKMDWVEGLQLHQVARDNAARPPILAALLQMWAKLARRLREAGIAHGDLQHGNVLLVPGSRPGAYGLKLIDYDGMYVPALANQPSGEVGHAAYQHPARASTRAYSFDLDRFPHLVIATALKGLEVAGPGLWDRYDTGDNLVFTEEDFRAPAASGAMKELWRTENPALQAFVGRLAVSCIRPIPQTPWLDQFAAEGDPAPLTLEERRQAALALGLSPPATSASIHPIPLPEEPTSAGALDLDPSDQSPRNRSGRTLGKRSIVLPLVLGGLVMLLGGVVAAVILSGNKPESSTTETEPVGGENQNAGDVKPKGDATGGEPPKKKDPDPVPPNLKQVPAPVPTIRTFEPIVRPPVGKLRARETWSTPLEEEQFARLVCSLDGRSVVVLGASKRPTLALDLSTGKPMPKSRNKSVLAGFPPIPLIDGRFAIDPAGSNTTVRLWNVATGQMTPAAKPFAFPERTPGRNVLSPNAEYLAFAGNERNAASPFRLKHVQTDRMILEMDLVSARVFFTADSARVLVAESTGKCRWFKLPLGEPDGEWELPPPPKAAQPPGLAAMSGDGTLLLFDGRLGSRTEPYHLIDGRNGSIARSFAGNYVARSADLSGDGRIFVARKFVAAKRSSVVEVIDTTSGSMVASIAPPAGNNFVVPFLVPDGSAVVVLATPKLGAAQTAIRYELVPDRPVVVPSPSNGSTWTVQLPESSEVQHLHVDLAANRLLLGGARGGFTMLDLASGQPRGEGGIPEPAKEGIAGFLRLRDGRFGTVNSHMDRIRLWEASTGGSAGSIAVREIPPGAGNARFARVYLSPNGKFLAVARNGIPASDHPEVPFQVFETSSNRLLLSTTWRGGSAHFTRDSERLLVAEWPGRFRWFKLPSGENDGGWDLGPPAAGGRHTVYGLSADGSAIAYNGPAGAKDGSSIPGVLDGKSGVVLQRFPNHFRATEPIISDDGRLALLLRDVSLDDCALEVVDVGTSQVVKSVRVRSGHRLPVYTLAPNGSALFVFNSSDRKLHSYALQRATPAAKGP